MGPHPECPIDVQKYIGSCLISQQPRAKRKSGPGGAPRCFLPPIPYAWTGVPLISVARHARHKEPDEPNLEEILPISRLAIHAQGAPLILSPEKIKEDEAPVLRPQSDCVSTTSEDSVTSENGLPRIIKPRKRRKKDRREGEDATIVTLKPYQPLCYRYSLPKTTSRRWPTGQYPYAPSARCRCRYCVPPPSNFLTPPDSPVHLTDDRPSLLKFLNPDDCTCSDLKGLHSGAIVLPSSHPPQRPWIQIAERTPKAVCTFTVMCYNILCDKYATRQMYGYCPNWALDWSYRKKSILDELLHYRADIISLQEVETEQFYKFFLPELKKDGYDGIFSPKSRAKTMSESERKHVDGCAIFYKTNKFFLLKEHLVEFNQLAMANAKGSDDMLNRVMTKDNIGLAALLQTRMGAYERENEYPQSTQTILVCTAHIHWDPEYSDVKLIQTMMLMHELKTFVDDILQKCNIPPAQKLDPNIIPLLLCGDFNSLPDSGVIEFLSSGRVSSNHCDFREFVYKDCLSKLGNSSKNNEFTHPFKISRAYNDGIMPFTNYSYDFKGVIDYVFYSKLHMSVMSVLGPVNTAWLEENRVQGCPHPHIPSDHFPILVQLQLNKTIPLHVPPPNGVNLHR